MRSLKKNKISAVSLSTFTKLMAPVKHSKWNFIYNIKLKYYILF